MSILLDFQNDRKMRKKLQKFESDLAKFSPLTASWKSSYGPEFWRIFTFLHNSGLVNPWVNFEGVELGPSYENLLLVMWRITRTSGRERNRVCLRSQFMTRQRARVMTKLWKLAVSHFRVTRVLKLRCAQGVMRAITDTMWAIGPSAISDDDYN